MEKGKRKQKRETEPIDFSEVFKLIDEHDQKTIGNGFELSEEAKKCLDELEKELNFYEEKNESISSKNEIIPK